MSRGTSNRRQAAGRGRGRTAPPQAAGGSIGVLTLLMLVCVVFVVALLMVISLVAFVLKPDPAVKAGPMYVTLALTTGAALLMLLMALNASYLPLISRAQAKNVHLVMWAMGVTGIVTGLLTVGRPVSSIVMRIVLSGIAFTFITIRNTRLAQARATALAGRSASPAARQAASPAARAQSRPRSRQRRGGRRH